MLDELLNQYLEKFGQNLPWELKGLSEAELVKILKQCIQNNKPYEAEPLDPNKALY